MSSDDEVYADPRRRSLVTPVPPSAGGAGAESPRFDNANDNDDRGSMNGQPFPTTAAEIASTDDRVRRVLYSDIGLSVLLNRLKQGVATCKELAAILRKRALIEDETGKSLQKLARSTQEILKRADVKHQGFNRNLYQALQAWDDSSASSINFSAQVHAMVDELTELAKTVDKKRKNLKHEALRDETNVTNAEAVAEKARSKYESLGSELERAISASRGESLPPQKGRFGMARRSGAQLIKHEEELRQKTLEADRDMQQKQLAAQELRRDLTNSLRPRNVKNLLDLVSETDAGVSYHLQKFAILTETLVANHATAIVPTAVGKQSFATLIGQISDARDFREYVLEFVEKIPEPTRYSGPPPNAVGATPTEIPAPASISNVRSPAPQLPEVEVYGSREELNDDVQRAASPSNGTSFVPPMNYPSRQYQAPSGPPPSQTQPRMTYPSPSQPPASYPVPNQPPPQPSTSYAPASQQSTSYSTAPSTSAPLPPTQQTSVTPPYQPSSSSLQPTPPGAFVPPASFNSMTPPPEKTLPSSQISPTVPITLPPIAGSSSSRPHASEPRIPNAPSPQGRTFGVSLEEIITLENATLPLVVDQCVKAINQFGLKTEGIYRVSGSASTIAKLKQLFDFEPDQVDFRTPAGFFGDIHAVAGVLKLYLRELPEPLLTKAYYADFMRVAPIEPDFHRRDAIHSLVNDLPDANYSCIRTLALHLHKVAQNSEFNKMTIQNLANIFGPTLLGSEAGGLEDARAQIRVAETIITYSEDMFELEDEEP